jgi:hypothetical protein
MALMKQNISISLAKGIDSKSDPKQVVMGKLLALQNATFQSIGRFKKRNGYGVINSSLSVGNAIVSYNDELVVLDGSNVYSYGEQLHDLTSKGKKVACDISVDSIIRNSFQQTDPDSKILNGLMCFAYSDSSGVVLYTVLDQVTKKIYVLGKQVGTLGLKPKVNSVGNYFVISYIEQSSLTLKALAINSTTLAETTVTVGVTVDFAFYDAAQVGTSLVYAYSGSGVTYVVSLSGSLNLGTPLSYANSAAFKCLFDDGTGAPYFGYSTGTGVSYIKINSSITSYTGPVVVETVSNVQNVTGIVTALGPLFFYEVLNATGSTADNFTRACQMVSGVGTPYELLRSAGLWSKPFIFGGATYLTVCHESKLQSCYFIIDSKGSVISRIAGENGGGLSKTGELREVNVVSSNRVQFAYLIKDFVSSLNGDVYAQTGVNSLILTFGGAISSQSIGNNLNLSGGVVSIYDGASVTEKNFNLYPEGLTSLLVLNGGSLSLGSYQWVAVNEWTDNKGLIHTSATSIPVTLDTSKLNKIYINGTVSSGSGAFNVSFLDQFKYGDGWTIIGPGIPSNTYITSSGRMNNNATASTSGVYTLTPGAIYQASTTIGSAVVSILQVNQYKKMVTSDSSSPNVFFYNPFGLQVGSTVQFPSGSRIILSISAGNAVLSGNAPDTIDRQYTFVTRSFTGDLTSGSSIITNVVSPFAVLVGDSYINSFLSTSPFTVTAVSGSSVTITIAASTSSTGNTFSGYLAGELPVQGTTLTTIQSNGFIGNVVVKKVSGAQVTFDQESSATDANDFYVTTDTYAAKIRVPTLRVTEKTAVSIAIYRTLANQQVFYRTSSLSMPIISSKSIDFIDYVDSLSDGQLIGNEQLYTTGSVVDNFPPPAASVSWTYKNRSMMVPSENTKTLWFSKFAVPGRAVEFSDQFIINVPDEGGAIMGGAQLDDKNVIFKKNTIFVQVGDGPTDTGAQNDFSDPQKIASDSGCINPKSIVLTPSGLMYQSEKGIYLLDRSLNVTYIGHDIEAYNSYSITSSKLIRELNQVRFSLKGVNTTLVFDYLINEWSVFNNPEVSDSTYYKGLYNYIAPTGFMYQETPGVFLDNTAAVLMGLTTSWLNFAGLQGFQRIYKMLLLGEYKSPHSLALTIAYDFKSAYNQSVTIPVLSAPSGAYQFRVDFKIQKCEAIQITLSETQTAPYGEGMTLSAFGLEVGAKEGLNKLPGNQSYG